MAPPSIYQRPPLKDDVYRHPQSFDFSQALHLLHVLMSYDGLSKTKATEKSFVYNPKDPVILKSRIFLSTPTSAIFSLKKSKNLPTPVLFANFMGLGSGAQGPFPFSYIEKLLGHIKKRDKGFVDFLDIFHHRLLMLYYNVEKAFYPSIERVSPEKTFQGVVLSSLAGAHLTDCSLPFSKQLLLMHANLFWKYPRNASSLSYVLRCLFGVDVEISSFQGKWVGLEASSYTYLGASQNILGETALLGTRAWCQSAGFRVRLHLHTLRDFNSFLPGGVSFLVLRSLVSFYVNPLFFFDVALCLRVRPPSVLGKKASSFYLGWSSWLGKGGEAPQEPSWTILGAAHFSRANNKSVAIEQKPPFRTSVSV